MSDVDTGHHNPCDPDIVIVHDFRRFGLAVPISGDEIWRPENAEYGSGRAAPIIVNLGAHAITAVRCCIAVDDNHHT